MAQNSDKIIVHVDSDLEELIPGYLDNRRRDVQSMLEALARGDYETIRVLGHSMKGSGGGYGFDPITEIGSCLERAAKARDREGLQKWVGELLSYLDGIEVVYE